MQHKITITCDGCKRTHTHYDTKPCACVQSLYCANCKSVQLHVGKTEGNIRQKRRLEEPQKNVSILVSRPASPSFTPLSPEPRRHVAKAKAEVVPAPAPAAPTPQAPPPSPPAPPTPLPRTVAIMGMIDANIADKRSIVTCGLRSPYTSWCNDAQRLCSNVCPEIPFTAYIERLPPGSKSHDESPYGFKVHALLEEYRKGFTQILWIDSAVELRHRPDLIYDEASEKGVFVVCTGHNMMDGDGAGRRGELHIAEWHGFTEIQPFQIVSTRVVCFDLENPVGLIVFNEWCAAEHAGQFKAKWPGDEQNLSYSLFKRGIPASSYGEYGLPDPLWWHKTLARI